ncbi:MAG: hypothetical protein KDD61_00120, partial [Bdellovibrionales bacterium]|nr:hypothetical protein [Bdellovibrionales bacterium]
MYLVVRFFYLISIFALLGCKLDDNRLDGQLGFPSEKALSIEKTEFESNMANIYRQSEVIFTVTTRDQFGDTHYNPTTSISLSVSGETNSDIISSIVDNKNGTYTMTFFSDKASSPISVSVAVNDISLPHLRLNLGTAISRIAYTGNSLPSALPTNRMYDETSSGWELTGNCDVEQGDVKIFSPDLVPKDSTTNCNEEGGGTFSFHINYDTISPYFSRTAGVLHLYARQQHQVPIHTWLYKTQSSYPVIYVLSVTDLQNMTIDDPNVFYIQMNDLNFVGTNNLTPIGTGGGFQGIFDGNGNTISGIDIALAGSQKGIFSQTENAQISNTSIINLTVNASSFDVGGLIGKAINTNLYHIDINSAYVIGNDSVGGIIGDGTSSNCFLCQFTGSVSGIGSVGGVFGRSFGGFVSHSVSSGSVSGSGSYTGGIVGRGNANSSIEYCSSSSSVSSTGNYVGGLSGRYDRIYLSSFTGTVSGSENVGGLQGLPYFPISGSFSSGDITISTTVAGGPIQSTNFIVSIGTPLANYFLSSAMCSNCNYFDNGISK